LCGARENLDKTRALKFSNCGGNALKFLKEHGTAHNQKVRSPVK
jgi:hypothetical protein